MNEHLRIVAIIQARMGSTRLPGKVLKPIAGKPLLWHVLNRLKRSHLIEDIAIATTTDPRDDAIVEFARQNGISAVRGPEDNVLARFAVAAEAMDADIIVRVSSDAPFIDADFIDHLLVQLIAQNGGYVLMEDGVPCAHDGVDPLTRGALDKLMMDAADDPVAREHVTGYFKIHPEFVPIARAPEYQPLARMGHRLTVDTPEDLLLAENIYAELGVAAGEAALESVLDLLDSRPLLKTINAHVRQKQLTQTGGVALFCCDGGGSYGYGHVKRSVALARALRDHEGIGSVFVLNGTADAAEPIRRAGFPLRCARAAPLDAVIRDTPAALLVLDGRDGPARADIAKLARIVQRIAVIDDASDRRLAAHHAYYPPVPQARALDWTGSRCAVNIGWEWSLLGTGETSHTRPHDGLPILVVTMGGSDPKGLTLRAARALAALPPNFRARFVIGPGMADRAAVAKSIASMAAHFETIEGAHNLSAEFARADMALCAFGVTAYELAAFGVPALYMGISEDHSVSASAFEDAGMGWNLGVADRVGDDVIARRVTALLGDFAGRRKMAEAGRRLIDGKGPVRIAADLARSLARPFKVAI